MKYLNIVSLSFLILLSGCGDDLEGLPDPDQKAPAIEPDSFSFETATLIEVEHGTAIYSQVPANQTRYYQFSLIEFHAGDGSGDLESLTLVTSSVAGALELDWYDGNQLSQANDNNSNTVLDFTTIDPSFPLHNQGGYSDYYQLYVSVKNDTEFEVEYEVRFAENQSSF